MKLPKDQLDAIRGQLSTGEIAVRWHMLRAFGRSNRQGYAALSGLAPEKKSTAIESGDAVDSELLDGLEGNVVAVPEDMKRDKRHEKYRLFLAENPGKLVLTQGEYDKVQRMVDSVKEHAPDEGPSASELLGGTRKSAILWQREEGIWCQGTPDSLEPVYLTDLKRTAPGNLSSGWGRGVAESFSKHARAMGWIGQLAFYSEAAGSLGMHPELYFVVVEAEPSLENRRHEVVVFRMTEQVHNEGAVMLATYWEKLIQFLEDGDLSGYGGGRVIDMEPGYLRQERQGWQ